MLMSLTLILSVLSAKQTECLPTTTSYTVITSTRDKAMATSRHPQCLLLFKPTEDPRPYRCVMCHHVEHSVRSLWVLMRRQAWTRAQTQNKLFQCRPLKFSTALCRKNYVLRYATPYSCVVAPSDVSRVLTAVTFRVTIRGILVPECGSTRFFQNVTLFTKRHGVTFRETGVFDWVESCLRRSTSNCRPAMYKTSSWRHFCSADFYSEYYRVKVRKCLLGNQTTVQLYQR